MNEFAKTGIALGSAAVLTVLALSTGPREVRLGLFDDQGQQFFPQFTDGEAIAELSVTAFREAQSDIYAFIVKRDDKGVWTIPSHGGYPADAKDQMGKAAAMLLGLTKQAVVGDSVGRHVEYGVVDPLAEGVETKGRGKRITMKDKAGNVLADLIVGNEVEGKPGNYYVRIPDKKRVYRTKLEGKLSTQFSDWIETDLLKAKSWDITKVVFDNYSVDEQKGEIVPGDKLVLDKDAASKWKLEGLDATKEETNEDRAREVGDALGQIKIVGVRAKPEGLTARLERANGIEAQFLAAQLQEKGFFLGRGGKLWSNEGDLLFETKSGVRYTLRFGELVAGEGDELTAGVGAEKPKEGETPADKPAEKPANNRYLMVTVEFDQGLIEKPTGVRIAKDELDKRKEAKAAIEKIQAAVEAYRAAHDNQLPASLAVLTEKPEGGEALLAELKQDPWGSDYQLQQQGDSYVVVSFATDRQEGGDAAATDVRSDRLPYEDELQRIADKWADYDRKVEAGEKEADKLTKRFGPWYYVIDQSLFAKLKPKREDLVKAKTEPKEGGENGEPGK